MTTLELTIIVKLKNHHRGKERAIHFKDLARNLDINSRELRRVVSGLVTSGVACIGSTSHDGYFYIDSKDELLHCYREMRSRGLKDLMRARGLMRSDVNDKQIEKLEQLVML